MLTSVVLPNFFTLCGWKAKCSHCRVAKRQQMIANSCFKLSTLERYLPWRALTWWNIIYPNTLAISSLYDYFVRTLHAWQTMPDFFFFWSLRLRHDVTAIAARAGASCCSVSEGESECHGNDAGQTFGVFKGNHHLMVQWVIKSFIFAWGQCLMFNYFGYHLNPFATWCFCGSKVCQFRILHFEVMRLTKLKPSFLCRLRTCRHLLYLWGEVDSCPCPVTWADGFVRPGRGFIYETIWNQIIYLRYLTFVLLIGILHDWLSAFLAMQWVHRTFLCLLCLYGPKFYRIYRHVMTCLQTCMAISPIFSNNSLQKLQPRLKIILNDWKVSLLLEDLLDRPTPCFRLPRMAKKLCLGGSFGLVLDVTGEVLVPWHNFVEGFLQIYIACISIDRKVYREYNVILFFWILLVVFFLMTAYVWIVLPIGLDLSDFTWPQFIFQGLARSSADSSS